MCPGKKHFVTIKMPGNHVHIQKRLILINLKELYLEYIKTKGDKVVFFPSFVHCFQWYIVVTCAGMHSICVCEVHQNVKLLVATIPSQMDYKDLLKKSVCSTES